MLISAHLNPDTADEEHAQLGKTVRQLVEKSVKFICVGHYCYSIYSCQFMKRSVLCAKLSCQASYFLVENHFKNKLVLKLLHKSKERNITIQMFFVFFCKLSNL